MLKSKEELENFLEKTCETIVFNESLTEKIRNYMLDKYNIPTGTTMDMISFRVSLSEKTEFELFCLLDGIDQATKQNYRAIYFNSIEIDSYSKQKMEVDMIEYPIRIPCLQVSPNQWMGVVNSRFFMKLRRSQMINYNANAQRVMKRIIRGESVLFKIVPNKGAIKAIRDLMRTGQYIPTPITLNIPFDSEADFYYDEKEKELVIKSLEAFDISDGYHRYLAMCKESDDNPDFCYAMEIRIINFTEEKTHQFIFQEDQKTKMARSVSNTMNTNRPSNIVIDRLNETSTFDFKGQIGRNEGTIKYNDLADIIEYFYFKEKKIYSNMDIRNAANDIKNKLNCLVEHNPEYLTKVMNLKELAIIFYVFHKEQDEEACKIIDKAIKSDISTQINKYGVNKSLFNKIEELIY